MVNAYIEEMDAIQALEQADHEKGVVGFFAEVTLCGESEKKVFYKARTLIDILKKAEATAKPGEMIDIYVTLWHVEGGMMREVGAFSQLAADAVWMHEYKEEKKIRPLIYSCKLKNHADA